ncbi:MAG: DUF3618 domain-containing protein [Ancrocorticia sp.]
MSSANIPEDKIRSAEQIEIDLKRQREEIANTVNELAERLDPKNLAKEASDQAKVKVAEFTDTAKTKANEFADTAKTQASSFADTAKTQASSFVDTAKKTVDEAKNGDTRALAILAGGAIALLGGIALILRRRK